jgi:non-ribosomal peptide synthetase component E (peptide arylation enzyme)
MAQLMLQTSRRHRTDSQAVTIHMGQQLSSNNENIALVLSSQNSFKTELTPNTEKKYCKNIKCKEKCLTAQHNSWMCVITITAHNCKEEFDNVRH